MRLERTTSLGHAAFGAETERGVALITALFTVLLLMLVGLALTSLGIVTVVISTNEREATEALYIADSGIAHAKAILLAQPVEENFDAFLQSGNGTACDWDELSSPPPADPPLDPIPSKGAGGYSFPPSGHYEVCVCDDDESTLPAPDNDPNHDANGRIRVISTGVGLNGSTATIEIYVGTAQAPALLVNGNLRINGNPEFTGSAGGVHSNGNLELTGNPRAEQYFSTSGTLTISGIPKTGDPPAYNDNPPELRPNEEPIEVPELILSDFKPLADYLLGNDGIIRDQLGTDITATMPDWSWDPGNSRWVAGNDISPGAYYAPGNIEISGNPGGGNPKNPPLPVTLIAEGWINVSGNPRIQPDLTTPNAAYSMIAGTDLKISGNPGVIYQGLHYAGHQVDFSGNPTINGQVIAKNLADFGTPQNLIMQQAGGFVSISGNPTINYDEDKGWFSTVLGWRECRGSNPSSRPSSLPSSPCL